MEPLELSIEDLKKDVCATVNEDLVKVLDIWKKMGFNVEELKERRKTMIKQLSNVAKDMYDEENRRLARVSKMCSDHMENITTLWEELQCEGHFVVEDEFKNMTLLVQEKNLREHVDLLNKEKRARLEEEKCLRNEEKDLGMLLGINCVKSNENSLLTENERLNLKNHIEEMKMIKEERENNILKMREEIAGLMDQLEMDNNQTPLTDSIMADETKSLTLADIGSIQSILDELKQHLKDKQTSTENLVKEINKLYDKLKVPDNDRLPLAMGHVCRTQDLHKYRSELEDEMTKLKIEKKKKIEVLVKDGKSELNELWEKCFIDEEDRGEFTRKTIGNSEDVYDLIENEIKHLTIYYNSNCEMLIKYKKLISLWATVDDLDIKSRDPNRLLKSRGNALFKEERERKQVAQLLPKIEQELYTMAEEYSAESGRVLSVGRISLVELIKTLRARHSQQLKNISLDLKVASKSMNATAFNNNTTKSILGTSKTPQHLAFLSSPRRPRNSPIAKNLHRPATHQVYSQAKSKFQVPKIQINFDATLKEFGCPEASSTFIGGHPTPRSNIIPRIREHSGLNDPSETASILISKNDSTLAPDDGSNSSEEDTETTARQKKKRFGFNFKKANLGGRCAAGRKAMKLNSVLSSASVRHRDGQASVDAKRVTSLLQGVSLGARGKGGRNTTATKSNWSGY